VICKQLVIEVIKQNQQFQSLHSYHQICWEFRLWIQQLYFVIVLFSWKSFCNSQCRWLSKLDLSRENIPWHYAKSLGLVILTLYECVEFLTGIIPW